MGRIAELKVRLGFWGLDNMTAFYAKLGDPAGRVIAVRGHDMEEAAEEIRAKGDLNLSKMGIFITASHSTGNEVLRDRRFQTLSGDVLATRFLKARENRHLVRPFHESLMMMNPPVHTALRKLVWPSFAPDALKRRESEIEAIVNKYLDRIDRNTPVNLMEEYCKPIPAEVMALMMGIPNPDIKQMMRWGSVLGPTLDGVQTLEEVVELRDVLKEMMVLFEDLIPYRRQNPGDDVISHIINMEKDGVSVEARRLLALTLFLTIAGMDTSHNGIGNSIRAMLEHEDQKKLFMDQPELTANAIEETLRFDPPVRVTIRKASDVIPLAGRKVYKRMKVMVLIGGANKDPRVFPDPERFDITRANAKDHLSMSAGIHFCLGSPLAKMMIASSLRGILERFPNLELAGPVNRGKTRVIRNTVSLPVYCHPQDRAAA
jgi:cytochrome P450